MEHPIKTVDYHIHTIFSGHSARDTTVGNIMHKANDTGLERIAILEHVPPWNRDTQGGILDNTHNSSTTIRAQIDAIIEEREIWQADYNMKVLIGAEVDADPNNMDGRLLLEDLVGIDIVLASTHYLPDARGIWYNNRDLPPETLKQVYAEWFVWIMQVAANPAVDVLAHPGASLCAIGAIEEFSGAVLDDFAKLMAVCEKFGTAFELNESLHRKMTEKQADTYKNVIKLAIDNNVKICPGSDAHELKKIGQYAWAAEIAESVNLEEKHIFVPE